MLSAPITRFTSTKGDKTIFVPLPREMWRECEGGCCCEFCSDDPKKSGVAYWDTLVIAVDAPKGNKPDFTSTCHYPELQGARKKAGR